MIEFKNLNQEKPYILFKKNYKKALLKKQKNIEAMSISTFNHNTSEVDSRYVNLKFIDDNKFIFFSNYQSPKANAFIAHDQIAALFYWSSINTQIRIKAFIKKTSQEYNQAYFFERSMNKNALAISSNQSSPISDFDKVINNYKKIKETGDLKTCPDHWGGYSFIPYEIEFWVGDKHRLNKRDLYKKDNNHWNHSILEP